MSLGPGATGLDELAAEAAQRALELRGLSEKGARARKKKALVDFLHALGETGVSHRRLAVPTAERSVHLLVLPGTLAALLHLQAEAYLLM